MTTEARLPIRVVGWIVLRDMKVDRVEVNPTDYDYGPLPYVSEYGEDSMVAVFHDPNPLGVSDRIEADADIVSRLREMAESSIDNAPWGIGVHTEEGHGVADR